MIKNFADGSRCIVEECNGYQVLHIRLGFDLNFIDKLVLVDGTIIQNMQYEINATIPTPLELVQKITPNDQTHEKRLCASGQA